MDWIQRPPNTESNRHRRHHDLEMTWRRLWIDLFHLSSSMLSSEAAFLPAFSRSRRGDGDVGDNFALHRDLPCSIFPTEGVFAVLLPSTLVPLTVTLVYGKLKTGKLGSVARAPVARVYHCVIPTSARYLHRLRQQNCHLEGDSVRRTT